MFTGIIQDIGTITAVDKRGDWTLAIESRKLSLTTMALGASIACNGICLTVINKQPSRFDVQISQETLDKTTAHLWQIGHQINLEPALAMGDALGGHLLTGHVDGVAQIHNKVAVGDSYCLHVDVPPAFAPFIAPKGSIALNGVSLTVNEVEQSQFTVNIIRHTQKETTFSTLRAGDIVNFEVDLIARYIHRMRVVS
jgi:riboflavin synthase